MGKGPETKFKERVLKDLKSVPRSKFVKIQQRSLRGHPDLFGSVGGVMFLIELKKSDREDADPLQKQELVEWAATGACAMICYPENWSESFHFIQNFAAEQEGKLGIFSSKHPKPTVEGSDKKH